MSRRKRKYLYWIGTFLLVFFVLPNIINFRERRFFSEVERIKQAREFSGKNVDSLTLIPGEYYDRKKFFTFFFGEKNRGLWTTPVNVKVLGLDTVKGGLTPYDFGGSQQTISVRLKDSAGRHWVLRSVNKDQQNALPLIIRHSALRFMFRDQVASMNPYAPAIVATLADAIQLPHCHPELYWVPFKEVLGKYNQTMAGRLVYLEEHLDTTWTRSIQLANVLAIVDTEDMQEMQLKQKIAVDTLLYLKTRLFDMLICDWDRHEDQWKWILIDSNGLKLFKPIAKDRDMAMYVFDEGILSHVALAFNNKFQSFRKDYKSISGLMHQSKRMDEKLLKGISKEQFIYTAKQIQSSITPDVIDNALKVYSPDVYQSFGKHHKEIFLSRLQKLPAIAETFFRLVND